MFIRNVSTEPITLSVPKFYGVCLSVLGFDGPLFEVLHGCSKANSNVLFYGFSSVSTDLDDDADDDFVSSPCTFAIVFGTYEEAVEFVRTSTWLEKATMNFLTPVKLVCGLKVLPLQIVDKLQPTPFPKPYMKYEFDASRDRDVMIKYLDEIREADIVYDCSINPELPETWWNPCDKHLRLISLLKVTINIAEDPTACYQIAREELEKCNSIFSEFAIIDILLYLDLKKYLVLDDEEHRRSLLESSNILQFIYSKEEGREFEWLLAHSMFFINQIFNVMDRLYRVGEYAESFVLNRIAENILTKIKEDENFDTEENKLKKRCFISNSIFQSLVFKKLVEHSGFKLDLKSSEYDVYTYQFHQHSNK